MCTCLPGSQPSSSSPTRAWPSTRCVSMDWGRWLAAPATGCLSTAEERAGMHMQAWQLVGRVLASQPAWPRWACAWRPGALMPGKRMQAWQLGTPVHASRPGTLARAWQHARWPRPPQAPASSARRAQPCTRPASRGTALLQRPRARRRPPARPPGPAAAAAPAAALRLARSRRSAVASCPCRGPPCPPGADPAQTGPCSQQGCIDVHERQLCQDRKQAARSVCQEAGAGPAASLPSRAARQAHSSPELAGCAAS